MNRLILVILCCFLFLGLGSPRPVDRMGEVVTKTNQLTPDPIELKRQSDKAKFDEARLIFEKERLKRKEEREFNKNTQPGQGYPLLP